MPMIWTLELFANSFGSSLALCELYLSLTALVMRVMPHMTLYNTSERDVRYDHDMFIPVTVKGSTGVRVTIEA